MHPLRFILHPSAFILFLLLAGSAFAQLRATTDDGRAVLLRADNTWQYADSARADTVFDFRHTRWGMSREAVRVSEPGTPVEETAEAITYGDTLSGFACRVSYIFAGDKLAAARYTISEEREDKNVYLGDFEDLKQALADKYGKPGAAKTRWVNDYYKGSPQYAGLAVSMGHMNQFATWQTPKSEVHLKLAGAEFRVLLTIDYTSRALKSELEAAAKQQRAKDF